MGGKQHNDGKGNQPERPGKINHAEQGGGGDLANNFFSNGEVARQVHGAKSLERTMTSGNVEPNDRRITGRKPSLDSYDRGSGRKGR